MQHAWAMNTNPTPNSSDRPLAVVHVRGRRVAWSLDPRWSPADPAFGPDYERARANGLAGRSRKRAHVIVRDLLSVSRGVLVRGADRDRVLFVTRPPVGGSIRTAWSDAPNTWWPVGLAAGSPAYEAAKARSMAGVAYGVAALQTTLETGIETPRTDKSGEVVTALRGLRLLG